MTKAPLKMGADTRAAKAFRNQHELPPYQELLRDTAEWLEPTIGQRWLDVGCGAGQLSRVLWEKSAGKIEAVIGVDSDAINESAYAELRARLVPKATPMCLRFIARPFADGFADWPGAQFDGVVAGLSLPYAESFCEGDGRWDESAYDRVLAEVSRLLKPGGTFVFSVNVPEPAWSKVAWQSLSGAFRRAKPIHDLKNAYRMWSHGSWLTRESRRGRFHYLPLGSIAQKLEMLGFISIENRLSYANQAYLIRCVK